MQRVWLSALALMTGCDPMDLGPYGDLSGCPHPAGVVQSDVAHAFLFDDVWEAEPPSITGVVRDAEGYQALRDAAPTELPDVDFDSEALLVTSVLVDNACDVTTSGYAFRSDTHGIAALDLTLESSRDTCTQECDSDWYVVIVAFPADWTSSVSSCVEDRCGG